jgi:phospho-N-acetylmuramoyl-pentapeptide-transferase
MLLSLSQALLSMFPEQLSFLRVFQYLTFRAVLAAMTALLIGLAFGPWVIRKLTEMKIGQPIREYGVQAHLGKRNTPTMGGVLVLIGIGVSTVLWFDWSNRFVWVVMLRDLRLRRHRLGRRLAQGRAQGPRRHALAREVLLAEPDRPAGRAVPGLQRRRDDQRAGRRAVPALGLERLVDRPAAARRPDGAVLQDRQLSAGRAGLHRLSWFVIVGASNAVNFTDGLDGLAIMPVVLVGSALGVFAYVVGNSVFSRYLLFPYIPGAGELLIFCSAMAGAGLAFLWFNANPAQVFMGDVGALALGGALGTIAVITRQEIVLGIMGGVFVAEALSVMIQVAWFKYTRRRYGEGRRIFLMAPLHHHFEKKGWAETQVVVRFWIVTMLLCLVGLASLKLR